MASMKPRVLADGTIVYDIKWRLGGTRDGAQRTETFNPKGGAKRDQRNAIAFKAALEANGHQWPDRYLPGVGFATDAQLAATAAASHAPVVTFAQHAGKWLTRVSNGVEPGTARRYERIIDNHLLPAFGAMDIADPDGICPDTIAAWVKDLRTGVLQEGADAEDEDGWLRRPLSPKSVRNLHGLFYAIMQDAVERERPLRSRNPCANTDLPSLSDGEGDEEMVFLETEEYALIRDQIKDEDARFLSDLLVGTGLRYSEATALQVGDFSLGGRRPYFDVWRAWKQREDGSYYLGTPKTKSSLRRIGLTGEQAEQVAPRLAGRHKKDLLVTGPKGGRFIHSTFFTRRWRPAVYKAARCEGCRAADYAAGVGRRGLTLLSADQIVWCGHEGALRQIPRVHDLRHSHVAWLIGTGAKPLAISRRLGHSSIQITYDRYGHLLREVEDDLVDGLEALMGGIGVGV